MFLGGVYLLFVGCLGFCYAMLFIAVFSLDCCLMLLKVVLLFVVCLLCIRVSLWLWLFVDVCCCCFV